MGFVDGSERVLAERYDVALLDLDGVVYVGPSAVPAAPKALAAARDAGMRLTFVTNNAARPPSAVAEHLTELGIPAERDEVVTSSQVAAHYLARRHPKGSKVLVVGTDGLIDALREHGLTPVFSADDAPVAVAQGYSPTMDWKQLAEGALAINAGAEWVATNLDATVPSQRGALPGNGSLVAALRCATGQEPTSTGKPDPTMHAETVERSGARAPLVVGDRLDTDIEGATRVGCDSLLVFTGVTDASLLLAAPHTMRPTYIATDVSGLLHSHPAIEVQQRQTRCGGWSATVDGDRIVLAGEGDDDLDALRALCALRWATDVAALDADSDQARDAVHRLGLATTGAGR